MPLKTQKDFLDKLIKFEEENQKIEGDFIRHNRFSGEWTNEVNRLLVDSQVFTKKKLRNITFDYIHFKNCEFNDCQIDDINSFATIYEDCTFNRSTISKADFFECDIINCSFNGCMANYFLFSDSSLSDLKFNYCGELLEFYFGGTYASNVCFSNSHVAHCRFEPNLVGEENSNYIFNDSLVTDCYFNNNNLGKSKFENCLLNKSIFANCTLSSSTFALNNTKENDEFASIDFHTINQSERINEDILRNVFGITESDIKSFTLGLSNDVVLQSVFISYSFKDKVFANKLNESLRGKGVLTFLWEKDAPGGRPLKRIMIDNVKKFDRLLFIASSNSIKSQACQFELSEGRKKQDINWTTILFPIHIDTFLFDLEKDNIKPREKKDEYWSNIIELREINSLDFSNFNKDIFDNKEFEKSVSKLRDNLIARQKTASNIGIANSGA